MNIDIEKINNLANEILADEVSSIKNITVGNIDRPIEKETTTTMSIMNEEYRNPYVEFGSLYIQYVKEYIVKELQKSIYTESKYNFKIYTYIKSFQINNLEDAKKYGLEERYSHLNIKPDDSFTIYKIRICICYNGKRGD